MTGYQGDFNLMKAGLHPYLDNINSSVAIMAPN